MDTSADDTPLQRTAEWFRATPLELVGLAVLLTGAFAASVVLWWQASSRPSELPSATLEVGVPDGDVGGRAGDGGGPRAAGAAEDPSAGAAADDVVLDERLLIHVTGAVERPGLVELDGGARVGDAVDAAGGLAPDAAPDLINLARPLGDGEHVRVPREGDDPFPDPAPPGMSSAGPDGVQQGGRVDINRAGTAELESLPGIGPARADAIVQHRESHGPFQVPGDLRQVSGIGEATFQRLADLISVG